MSFDWSDVAELVKGVQRTQVWGFNVYVEVDDAYVDEIDDNDFDIDVYLKAYGDATIRDDYEYRRLQDGLQSAARTIMDRIDDALRRYHNSYGFGYRFRIKDFSTDDIDIDSY